MNTKLRLILTGAFILVSAAIGYAIYAVFFAPPEAPEVPPEEEVVTTTPGELPEAEEREAPTPTPEAEELPEAETPEEIPEREIEAEPRVSQPVTENVSNVDVDQQGNARFYNQEDGRFYRINENGELELLADQTFFNVQNASWAPNEDKAILEYPDGNNIYYNFETEEQETLPQHWQDFSFSPEGSKIAAKSIGYSPDNRWLVESDPEGSSVRRIENMGENADKVSVDWSPNKQAVGLSRTGDALGADRQEVLVIGRNQENFQSIVAPGQGFQSKWSPNGEKLLFSVYNAENNFNPELWSVNAKGGQIGTERKRLNIDTWATKCTFASERTVYCGVPSNLERGSGFEPELAQNTDDGIYKIDLQTGSQTLIPTDQESFTVSDIHVRNGGSTLVVTDVNRSGIFEIEL